MFQPHIILIGGGILIGSFLASRIRDYLRRAVFGDREGVDLVEAFGTVQNFEVATFAGHTQDVECVEVVPGKGARAKALFASACLGGQIRVWDHDLNRCVEVLHCRNDEGRADDESESMTPWCLTTHGTFVAAGYAAGMIQIWDLATRAMVLLPKTGPLPGEGEPNLCDGGAITCVELFDNALVSGSSTGVLQLWHWSYGPVPSSMSNTTIVVRARLEVPVRNSSTYDLTRLADTAADTADARLTFCCIKSRAFHNSGVAVLKITDRHIISASNDKLVKIFDKNLVGLRSLYGHDAGITCLDVFQDLLVTGSADNSLKVWAISEGLLEQELIGHTDAIVCVCINAWHIVSSSEDDTIRVWDSQSGVPTFSSFWTISHAVLSSAPPHPRRGLCSAWCPCSSDADWRL